MILLNLSIKVNRDRREELVQTVRSLYRELCGKNGLVNHGLYGDLEDDNSLLVVQEWETKVDLDAHLGSDTFRVLMGALSVLTESRRIRFDTVSRQAGEEVIDSLRDAWSNEKREATRFT